MPKEIKRVLVFVVGIIFTILGIAGLVLPLLQGILFLVIGLMLLSLSSPKARRWIELHTIRYPKLNELVRKTEKWLTEVVGKFDSDDVGSGHDSKS